MNLNVRFCNLGRPLRLSSMIPLAHISSAEAEVEVEVDVELQDAFVADYH